MKTSQTLMKNKVEQKKTNQRSYLLILWFTKIRRKKIKFSEKKEETPITKYNSWQSKAITRSLIQRTYKFIKESARKKIISGLHLKKRLQK